MEQLSEVGATKRFEGKPRTGRNARALIVAQTRSR
jgi:hypothetical protein